MVQAFLTELEKTCLKLPDLPQFVIEKGRLKTVSLNQRFCAASIKTVSAKLQCNFLTGSRLFKKQDDLVL